MKRKLLVTAVLAVLATVALPERAWAENPPVIEVTGAATVNIVPNRVTIEVGMEEYFEPTAPGDSVMVKLSEIEQDVRRAFLAAGVPDSHIVVADMGASPNRPPSAGFLRTKRLSAAVENLEQVERISERLGRKGITGIGIMRIENTEIEQYNREGLKAALDAARRKAEFIAENEGLEIGMPLEIVENGPNYYDMPTFSNVSFDSGSGMENMRRIVRRYSVKVRYLFSKK